jgi:hypothetical protein
MRLLATSVLVLSTSAIGSADPLGSPPVPEPTAASLASAPATSPALIDIGVRIGGYGFRRDRDPTSTGAWDECRMNGVGIFGQRGLRGPVFGEVGIDAYFSASDHPNPNDLPVSRSSALLSTAIGVRTELDRWVVGYVQVGVGAELTRVSVPYADGTLAANKLMPEGFIGVGGDLRIGEATRFGASIRTLVMGNFNYDPQRLQPGSAQWTSSPTAGQVFAAEPTLAAQAQFYIRRDL